MDHFNTFTNESTRTVPRLCLNMVFTGRINTIINWTCSKYAFVHLSNRCKKTHYYYFSLCSLYLYLCLCCWGKQSFKNHWTRSSGIFGLCFVVYRSRDFDQNNNTFLNPFNSMKSINDGRQFTEAKISTSTYQNKQIRPRNHPLLL